MVERIIAIIIIVSHAILKASLEAIHKIITTADYHKEGDKYT